MPKDCIEEAIATAVACDFDPERTANFIINELDDHGFAIIRAAENERLQEDNKLLEDE